MELANVKLGLLGIFFSWGCVQAGRSKEVQCIYGSCSKMFATKSSMQIHVSAVHLNIKRFTCPSCGKCFSQKGNMKQHVQAIHNNLEYQCEWCSKKFSSKYYKWRHQKRCAEMPKDEYESECVIVGPVPIPECPQENNVGNDSDTDSVASLSQEAALLAARLALKGEYSGYNKN